ncbi:MAG: hypothetical protein IPK88_02055 [Saprospiraceae bacterium]|nr:hypothetical protein [Candidatus Defluviibacterium haderslevense]MBK7244912.1 hypothetical protein [Candidatus Defluviibacterium haderslevense]MBK8242184.1 hypothetical protein [Candidatus Defluviibacterium haderslevense]MCC7026350.1 hypothetical protein [Saprospiraceae bacterium]
MKDKNNKAHSPNHLVVLNPTIVHDDHKNSEEKDCCGSCQGNGVCSKVALQTDEMLKELKKD